MESFADYLYECTWCKVHLEGCDNDYTFKGGTCKLCHGDEGRSITIGICLVLGVIIHYFLSYLFLLKLRMGITGTGVAGLLMNMIILIIQFSYTYLMMPEVVETYVPITM